MFLVCVAKFRSRECTDSPWTSALKRDTRYRQQIWPIIRNNLETVPDRICKLVLFTWKCRTGFRLVPKSVTLNDLERRSRRHFPLFHRVRHNWETVSSKWLNLDPCCLQHKCGPKNLLVGGRPIWFTVIFSYITETECVDGWREVYHALESENVTNTARQLENGAGLC